MLDKNYFLEQVNKLVIEYKDFGFTMSKEKASQWYENVKEWRSEDFKNAVDYHLRNINKMPVLADLFIGRDKTRDQYRQKG